MLLADYAISDPQLALTAAKEAAIKTLEIDDTLSEAHNAMGFVLACHDHDWTQAEHHYLQAKQLDPHSAATRLAYSLSLLVPNRRFEEAMDETTRASRLAPVTPMMIAGPGVVLTYDRCYDKAITVFQEALELDPQSPVVNLWSTDELGIERRGLRILRVALGWLRRHRPPLDVADHGRCLPGRNP